MTRTEISNFDDIIDLREIHERIEELEEEGHGEGEGHDQESDEAIELRRTLAFSEECKGNGGDEKWRGEWYPLTAIRDSYFKDYAQELAEDIGAIPAGLGWPCTCIDWDQAARELQMDYTAVEFDGITYWVR